MKKLSGSKVAQILHDAENALRAVTAERDEAQAKLASISQRRDAEKLASAMHKKGINTDVEIDELANSLEKAAEQGRLPIIEEAVGMMGRNMSLGHINNDERIAGSGLSELENFVMGDVG